MEEHKLVHILNPPLKDTMNKGVCNSGGWLESNLNECMHHGHLQLTLLMTPLDCPLFSTAPSGVRLGILHLLLRMTTL